MSHDRTTEDEHPLRILTIDNGGLQALSILEIVHTICKQISEVDGSSQVKAPHEVFDIIAGIGTGGWLAILLGRYKLTVEQCMISYISIANDINPKRRRSDPASTQRDSSAISQERLIDIVDRMIDTHDLGEHLIDEEEVDSNRIAAYSRKCHAFAVGAVKPTEESTVPEYRLFRAYAAPAGSHYSGPAPQSCKVSQVCAATAAARNFLQECEIENVIYWDNKFPSTHKISSLALDEANVLFPGRRLGVIVSVSPGLPTLNEIKKLQKAAADNTTTLTKARDKIARARSAIGLRSILRHQPPRAQTSPPKLAGLMLARSDTAASTASSTASQTESEHQKALRDRLNEERAREGGEAIYQRLALVSEGDKPYLDDIDNADKSRKLVDDFLAAESTKTTIHNINHRCSIGRPPRAPPTLQIATDIVTASPAASDRSSVKSDD